MELLLTLLHQSGGSSKSWAKYVATMGKNVKKYAEVGLSRIVASVPSKLSNEEFSEYRALIRQLCDRAQVTVHHVSLSLFY